MTLITFRPAQTQTLRGKPADQFDLRFLITQAERDAAFALRYTAYRALLGDELQSATGRYSDAFDDMVSTVAIGAYDGDRLVASMRLCFSRPGEDLSSLPCAAYYPALKDLKRQASGALMEVSRLSLDPEITNTSYRTTLYATLVRAGLLAAEAAGVSHILIAMQPSSVRFYKYMLGFEVVGEPACYPPGDMKIWLLSGSISQARLRQRMQNAFFRITSEEIQSFRQQLTRVQAAKDAAE